MGGPWGYGTLAGSVKACGEDQCAWFPESRGIGAFAGVQALPQSVFFRLKSIRSEERL